MNKKHVIIIGAGPGGLTSGMILAKRGCRVTIYEQANCVGGRNAAIEAEGFRFDTGPTFLMMSYILKEIFRETGRRVEDYLDFVRLDPMYRLQFDDLEFIPSTIPEKTRQQIKDLFPGNESGFDRFMDTEEKRFEKLFPCLQKDYDSWRAYLDLIFLKAAPWLSFGKSLYQNLSRYYDDDRLRLCFTFQAKYLGMSPWDCPAMFTMLPYIEYGFGILHVMGGLNRISHAMAKVVKEEGGTIHLNQPVRKLLLDGRTVKGVELENGHCDEADAVFINADFGHAMEHLVAPGEVPKYSSAKLNKLRISCSTVMFYLGLNTIYKEQPHHNILFASDYHSNLKDISERLVLSEDPSIYVQNASVTDPSLAPEGKSTLYILVPVPNNRSKIDWQRETPALRERVLDIVERRGGFINLRDHIIYEKITTPKAWEDTYSVYHGATFNLAHNFGQLLSLRPHNHFESLKQCWLVGGGTHPGSGLPTIYESGRISANSFCKLNGLSYSVPGNLELKEMIETSSI